MKQIPLPIGPLPQPRFDNFLPGANAAALEHLQALACPAAPVYLWGPAGSGKSHLLRALASQCQQAGQLVGWFDATDSLPWVLSPEWAVVIIDRCEALSADAQHAAFALFVEAMTHGVQVAAAGRLPPIDLALREDLRTRLAWGHVFALQPLADAETRAALRREADHRGIFLSDEVMHHVLTHFPRDLSHLMALLDQLDNYALSRGRKVTVPLLKQMLAEAQPRDRGDDALMKLALFDLDGTLIPKDSDHAFGEFVITLGWADAQAFRRRNDDFYQDYLQGQLDINAYVDFATSPWRDRSQAELTRASERFLDLIVQPMLTPAAIDLVRGHQKAGDLVAIVTATNDFVTRPIARLLGVDELIATDLMRDAQGRVTGAIAGVPSFREGKVTRVQDWLAARGLAWHDFESTTFYSDSTNDLPLLERVSHPVATNPGPALERIARERGWPVLKLFA